LQKVSLHLWVKMFEKSPLLSDLESLLSVALEKFEGQPVDQKMITSIWEVVYAIVRDFNSLHLHFSDDVVHWMQSGFVNKVITIGTSTGTKTIGEMTTQEFSSVLTNVFLFDLYRLRDLFRMTRLEDEIVDEINRRTAGAE